MLFIILTDKDLLEPYKYLILNVRILDVDFFP